MEESKVFFAILDSKRHNEDVKWAITAMKAIDVAKIMEINTTTKSHKSR
jgi:hypothetical protein